MKWNENVISLCGVKTVLLMPKDIGLNTLELKDWTPGPTEVCLLTSAEPKFNPVLSP